MKVMIEYKAAKAEKNILVFEGIKKIGVQRNTPIGIQLTHTFLTDLWNRK